jgi:hypothetical protein
MGAGGDGPPIWAYLTNTEYYEEILDIGLREYL